jgi:hypothetical protein
LGRIAQLSETEQRVTILGIAEKRPGENMAGMDQDQLKAITDAELRQAVGYQSGKLANMRQKALWYYEGLAKGDLAPPDVEGRSGVVSTDVRNTIEAMMPELMAKFASSERVVELEATKQQDEQAAKLASDYLNYLFYKKNDGHNILETWFKDALISKAGIIKVWWDTRTEEAREDYKGLDDVELAQLMDDEEVEVTEGKSYPDEEDAEQRQKALQQMQQQLAQAMQAAQQPAPQMPQGGPQNGQPPDGQMGNPQPSQQGDQKAQQAVMQLTQQIQRLTQMPPKMKYDVTCKRTRKGGKVAIENVPPEEFLISRKAKNIKDAPFCGHRIMRTVSELKSMGYKNVDDLTSDDNGQQFSMERTERLAFDDDIPWMNTDQPNMDESQRIIWVTECYMRVDYDGDGIAELRKVVRAGNTILENEVVDAIPFVHVVPVKMPHRFFGLSVADLSMETQRIKTSILRAMLDNLYLQVNGRYFAVEGQVNLDDLLTSRPGGVVRTKSPGAVGRLDQAAGDSGNSMAMLQYMEQFLENSAGYNRMSQSSPNADSLNQTATAANIVTNKADMRTDLIARNFAEGVVDLFKMMLKLVCQHQDYAEDVKLGGDWVNIDPREWRNQFQFTINIGLGTGNKDQLVQHLMMQLNVQKEGMQIGITSPAGIYQSAKKLSEALGFKNCDVFWTDPAKQPPQQPKPNPDMQKIQMQTQADAQKFKAQTQVDMQKQQFEMQMREKELAMQAQTRQQELELEAQKQQLQAQADMQERQHKAELDAQLASQRLQFDQWKVQTDNETRILIAQINAGVALNKQQMAAAEAVENEEEQELNGNA